MSVEVKAEVPNEGPAQSLPEGEPSTAAASADDDEASLAAQYPCNADDVFECKLIDSVEKNQCIYNRCHPLHKMADYKTHVWNQIAKEMNFSGPGVELERKWRHMRDRYVRLRKLVKTSQPLRKNDKWLEPLSPLLYRHRFYYYQKMSFLDPYVEHRNRRKRGDLLNNVLNVTAETPDGLGERQDEEGSDSGEGEADVDPLKGFYASFIQQAVQPSSNGGLIVEVKQTSPVISQVPAPTSSSSIIDIRGVTPAKKPKTDRFDEDCEESEVSLFVRSIEKTLKSMEPQTFSLARLEISRVIYECQFGKKTK